MPLTSEERRRLRARALAHARSITPEEDAKLTAAALSDADNPPLTADFFRRARLVRDVRPELIEAAKKLRGRPKLDEPKVQVTLRLDADVVKKFRAGGPGWQSRINDLLVDATKRRKRA